VLPAAGILVLALFSGCGYIANENATITVINQDSDIGKVYVDGEATPDVMAVSYFTETSLALRAELIPGQRSFFNGWMFCGETSGIDGAFGFGDIVRKPEVTVPVDEYHRLAVARFCHEENTQARFLDEGRILYHDNRDGRSTWRVIGIDADGNKSQSSIQAVAGDQDGYIHAESFPSNPWVLFTHLGAGNGHSSRPLLGHTLWNADDGNMRDVQELLGFSSSYSFVTGTGSPDGNLLLLGDESVGYSASGGSLTASCILLLDRAGTELARRTFGYDAEENVSMRKDSRTYALILVTGEETSVLVDGSWNWFNRPVTCLAADVEAGTLRPLYAFTDAGFSGNGDFFGTAGTDSATDPDTCPFAVNFRGFAPDDSNRMLFASNPDPETGCVGFALVVDRDGNTVRRFDLASLSGVAVTTDYHCSLRWMDDSSGIAWGDADGSWWSLPLTGALSPVSIGGEPDGVEGDWSLATVSPSGRLTLEEIRTDGAIDVGVRLTSGPEGSAINLTEGEASL